MGAAMRMIRIDWAPDFAGIGISASDAERILIEIYNPDGAEEYGVHVRELEDTVEFYFPDARRLSERVTSFGGSQLEVVVEEYLGVEPGSDAVEEYRSFVEGLRQLVSAPSFETMVDQGGIRLLVDSAYV